MRPNKIPLEVELDIRQFIQNYPSRESYYSPSVKMGRKYIESDKNIKTLHQKSNFIQIALMLMNPNFHFRYYYEIN